MLQKIHDLSMRRFAENPLLWFAFALFVFSQYHLYVRGKELTLVCRHLYQPPLVGPSNPNPTTDIARAELICWNKLSN